MNTKSSNRTRSLIALFFAALGIWSVALTGCSTVEGMGEDIEYAGDKLSETSRDAQD